MAVKERIDQQIEERAEWLARDSLAIRAIRPILHRMLSYDRTVELAREMEDWSGRALMDRMGHMLARDLQVSGLHHIPRHGPALIVANHPTGIADGIMLHHLLAPLRPDLYFYANVDILKVVPQLEGMIAPVEWRHDKRSHGKTRETMAFTMRAMKEGRLGIIFPSGRLAKRRGLRLYERDWMASAAMLARKFEVPVIPIHIGARNSALFYLFDLLHETLRDITLFHEMLNKASQPYRISIGQPISGKALDANSDEAIRFLKNATLSLSGDRAQPLFGSARPPALISGSRGKAGSA
ncbi:lysophospholipid acyltransferase family protein [Maribius pontilimi]|uniref:Lysophospholipid acyltransferase family protein n=1 Tax=Palleronia pontilimi TaxID=1964209 RepID=A0A934MCR7_9RHOB|nr:lysophospholipid acyltransferase family protein [Palleronia pontilimi]MBJ3762795.1 lysophospholipid acyltransferase family protein [Palleronia pontilimi]